MKPLCKIATTTIVIAGNKLKASRRKKKITQPGNKTFEVKERPNSKNLMLDLPPPRLILRI